MNTITGQPFFYLGDTAWELLHRTDEEEARMYLTDRAKKGFNVVQTVVLAELEGLTAPNSYGELPLVDQDPTQWNEAYFTYVDRVAEMADSLGIFLGLLPTWGDKFNQKWGVGPEVFTPENAETYGRMLGERYRDHNVIWILGGDRNPENEEDFAIIRAMAAGLETAVGNLQLLTYHPQGGYKSSDFFAEDEWVDFHMFQSGHGRRDDKQNYDFPREVRQAVPDKPVVNGEPAYEDHPVNWRPVNGWFDDFDTRQAAYWSVLSGTAGHTFGNHNIWQMWQPGRAPISSARTPWKEAVHYPGVAQMGHLRKLMESLPYYDMHPDWDLLNNAPNSSGRETVVAHTEDMTHLLAYTPYGDELRVDADQLPTPATYTWFNPRSGERIPFTPEEAGNELVLDPPLDPTRGNDWVLIVSR
ncbi:apiosidase-like domain-containing protein [Neolewinella maritima]|uniref:apiosidase-like domain-containing protein n=1 Tax=Neolewinella maritima TaxID=1383882 RepID=UPI001EE8BC0E|nr:DUF4038 domain-containing protein [Neolewinella maritima]